MSRYSMFRMVICSFILMIMISLLCCPVSISAEALPAGDTEAKEPADIALARLNRYAEMAFLWLPGQSGYSPDRIL